VTEQGLTSHQHAIKRY